MTIHEKLLLARHLERAARAYDADAAALIGKLGFSGSMEEVACHQHASEARTYAALLREGAADMVIPKVGAL